jgi:hypothetical protein
MSSFLRITGPMITARGVSTTDGVADLAASPATDCDAGLWAFTFCACAVGAGSGLMFFVGLLIVSSFYCYVATVQGISPKFQ